METTFANFIFTLKQLTYAQMRRMAIGMTSAYLPPVVPRRTLTGNPKSQKPIRFDLRGSKRFAWQRQIVRHSH